MATFAKALPTAETIERERVRRGPGAACEVYGDGDLEDWAAVERLRLATNWATAHREVDKAKKHPLADAIDEDRFRYHWRRKCWHWSAEQKRVRLEDLP